MKNTINFGGFVIFRSSSPRAQRPHWIQRGLWEPLAWWGLSCPHRNALSPLERWKSGDGFPQPALPPAPRPPLACLLGRS